MSTDLRLAVPNRPGMLIQMCEALASAGVKLEGVCGDLRPGERWGYLHLLVDDPVTARSALEGVGAEVAAEHDVEVQPSQGSPEQILDTLRSYTGADRNVEVFYVTLEGNLVVGTEDMRKERPGVKMRDARY